MNSTHYLETDDIVYSLRTNEENCYAPGRGAWGRVVSKDISSVRVQWLTSDREFNNVRFWISKRDIELVKGVKYDSDDFVNEYDVDWLTF